MKAAAPGQRSIRFAHCTWRKPCVCEARFVSLLLDEGRCWPASFDQFCSFCLAESCVAWEKFGLGLFTGFQVPSSYFSQPEPVFLYMLPLAVLPAAVFYPRRC